MEAALVKPMVAEVKPGPVSAELEVKKLQELVRKLEQQNEQLRNRANAAAAASPSSAPAQGPRQPLLLSAAAEQLASSSSRPVGLSNSVPALLCQAEPFVYFKPSPTAAGSGGGGGPLLGTHEALGATTFPLLPATSLLDEVEVLDLLGLSGFSLAEEKEQPQFEKEETWLYVAPTKGIVPQEKSLSPLQWCRRVLDNPSPEMEAAKRSLCFRLEQASRWRSLFSSPVSLAFPSSPVARLTPYNNSCNTPVFTKTFSKAIVAPERSVAERYSSWKQEDEIEGY